MKIQSFKHIIIYEYSKKNALNKKTFHKLQSHLVCWHTKMCRLIRHIICESLVEINTIHNSSSVMSSDLFPKNILILRWDFKKALCLMMIFVYKITFLFKFITLFDGFIYFLQNSEKILVLNSSGWLVLQL